MVEQTVCAVVTTAALRKYVEYRFVEVLYWLTERTCVKHLVNDEVTLDTWDEEDLQSLQLECLSGSSVWTDYKRSLLTFYMFAEMWVSK